MESLNTKWDVKRLDQVALIIAGQSPPSDTYNTKGLGLPFFQGKAEFTNLNPRVQKWCSNPIRIAHPDDILISVRAPVGDVNIANQLCCIGRGLAAIRYPIPKYLFYYFILNKNNLAKKGTGSTFNAISINILKELNIPFPPLPEQQRIVEKIEELFSELDNGIANLKEAKEQLKVYRQSVLKWAFEGRLTNVDVKEGELPKGWKLMNLHDITLAKDGLRRGPFGSAIKKDCFVPNGYKVYEQGNAINDDPYRGKYFVDERKYQELKNFTVLPGDLIVSCSGVTLGRISEIPDDAQPGIINQALLRIRLKSEIINNKYFVLYFRSSLFQKKIFEQSQGTAMPNLVGIKDFREIEMLIPPIEEQIRISREIESRFSIADQMEQSIDESLQQAEALRQSILKSAFEGRLLNY
jgi:type I restriction enzyme, S subunit